MGNITYITFLESIVFIIGGVGINIVDIAVEFFKSLVGNEAIFADIAGADVVVLGVGGVRNVGEGGVLGHDGDLVVVVLVGQAVHQVQGGDLEQAPCREGGGGRGEGAHRSHDDSVG